MNMNEIKIEKGIPLPPTKRPGNPWARGAKWAQLLRHMEIGDSALVPKQALSSIYPACRRNGWKVRIQKQADGETVRLWRVPKEIQ